LGEARLVIGAMANRLRTVSDLIASGWKSSFTRSSDVTLPFNARRGAAIPFGSS
jgi:hypothetical protein